VDRESLKEWLEGRPREEAILIVHRAALRIWPFWGAAMREGWAHKRDLTSLPILRCNLSLGVACKYQVEGIREVLDTCHFSANRMQMFHTSDARSFSTTSAVYSTAKSSVKTASIDDIFTVAACVADAITVAYVADIDTWDKVAQDVAILTDNGDLLQSPLWHGEPPPEFLEIEQQALETLAQETGDRDSYWHRWYFAAKRGAWLDWEVQRQIALLPDDVWQAGHAAVAAEIARIEASRQAEALDAALHALPPVPTEQVSAVKAAMERNRAALPPTFDAIEGLLLLEIERLQRSNVRDEAWRRQMEVYLALHDAIIRLRAILPAEGLVTDSEAETSERLVRLYCRKFAELPRAKVNEVVEGVWDTGKGVVKAGLVGTTALLGVSYGLPVLAGVALGAMVFAPKSAGEFVGAARAALPKP
jgi:hypothetical protein